MRSKNKLVFCVLGVLLLVSTGLAQDIEPPPTPGDVEADNEPEDTDTSDSESNNQETNSDSEDSAGYDSDRIDQQRGVDETGDHSEGGMQETGISGVISSIGSFISSLIPF